MQLICSLLSAYLIVIFGRVILSWFPITPGSGLAGVYGFVYTLTEPVLGPVRRILPPLGGFDLSPIVVIIGVNVLRSALCSTL